MVAEISAKRRSMRILEELQWGRDQLVAEICDSCVARNPRSSASMGPRPIGRGNSIAGIAVDHDVVASMGPRPIGRGNTARCGRFRCGPRSFNGAATNWSRKSQRAGMAQLRRTRASMGPRPIGRGNDAPPGRQAREGRALQWGRDQLVAEMLRSHACMRSRSLGFNGAATNWSRKSGSEEPV